MEEDDDPKNGSDWRSGFWRDRREQIKSERKIGMSVKEKTREDTKIKIQEPKHYQVIMHNDDFTSMEFVVDILIDIFRKDQLEAERLMLLVHQSGKASVGSYPYDIAVTKVQAATVRAKDEGFPFRMTVEEV